MLGNEFVTGLMALAIGYLLGSIPTAFLVTKIFTGRDIRRLGGGNVGGLNTYKEVGRLAAVIVVLIDIGKGAAAVSITFYALQFQQIYVLLAACGAILGHNWMPWLSFRGGKGMGPAVGAITTVLLVYHQPEALIFFFGILVLALIITRNVTLSNAIALLGLPFICWLSTHRGLLVIWSVATGLIISIKFLPQVLHAFKSKSWKGYIKG